LAACALTAVADDKATDKATDKGEKLAPAPRGFASERDNVEHGKVQTVEYDSKTVGNKRRMVVYTPPGYTKDKKYPVLYLLHGAGDNETGWTRKGSAAHILDNLLAEKKVVPMLVVMPYGYTQAPGGFGPGATLAPALMRMAKAKDGKLTEEELVAAVKKLYQEIDKGKKGSISQEQLTEGLNQALRPQGRTRPGGRGGFGANGFENDLIKDVIPYVEKHYSVVADSDHRALAGLSMGGGQALTIGLTHLDTFGSVGGFSAAIFRRQGDLVPKEAGRKKLRLLWISCGDEDRLMEGSKGLHEAMEKEKVPHVWHVDSGGHTWAVWKNDLYLLAQKLFREGATKG
jgi:enterochelin esterase-like enzyme